MIVDLLNTYTVGGAAAAALRLHESLRSHGVASRFWYKATKHPIVDRPDDARPLNWPTKSGGKVRELFRQVWMRRERKRALRGRGAGQEVFTSPRHYHPTKYTLGADILNLHWVADWLDLPSFFTSLRANLPVVWTLHDMNPFTGGCHFSGDCRAFIEHCRHCPQLGQPHKNDLSTRGFKIKQQALRKQGLHIVAPSRWLMQQAQQSRLFATAESFQTIPYGLDTDLFAPADKQLSKQQLGLPTDNIVIGFGADSFQRRRKGLSQLLQALTQVASPEVTGLMFGQCDGRDRHDPGLPVIRSMGYVSDRAKQARIYAATDIFVLPSLEDNLPQTGLEAMACGTPVVAFDSGGISDYVRVGRTGLLARSGNSGDLAHQLRRLIKDRCMRCQMGANARAMVEQEYSRRHEATAYIDLFQRLIADPMVQRAASSAQSGQGTAAT
jgi:glycosyltransferase involved in cell wall biosynthesis